MKNNLLLNIHLIKNDNKIGKLIQNDEQHKLTVSISKRCNYANLDFTTRESLYDFALSLLHTAIYCKKIQKRYTPIKDTNGRLIIKDGIRLSSDSCDLIISVVNQKNEKELSSDFVLTGDIINNNFLDEKVGDLTYDDEKHQLKVSVNKEKNYALLLFTTREMLYDFAVALLSDVINGEVARECLSDSCIDENGNIHSLDGVRMALNSARLFIFVNDDDEINNENEYDEKKVLEKIKRICKINN
ncbi:MAG: hypothetical protein J6M43_03070 [Neisseriaceae bacterium]|nr:hypothetical protein [Neisseriaceae bacterium]